MSVVVHMTGLPIALALIAVVLVLIVLWLILGGRDNE